MLILQRYYVAVNQTNCCCIICKSSTGSSETMDFYICGILLTQSHKEALKSPNQWLDDDLINAAQYLLKNKTHLLMDFSLLFCLLNFKWSLEEHPSFRY